MKIKQILEYFSGRDLEDALYKINQPVSGRKSDKISRLSSLQIPIEELLGLFPANSIRIACDSLGIQIGLKTEMVEDLASLLNNSTANKKYSKDNNNIDTEKITRKIIPKDVRNNVWRRYWGNTMDGQCYVCGRPIQVENFECGHIVAVSVGGTDNINNLVPICKGCNLGMKEENLFDYKNQYYSHVIVNSLVQPEFKENYATVTQPLETKKKMSSGDLRNKLENLPISLAHTLEVYYYVLDGLTRNEATNLVAKRKNITPSTVSSSYTRQLERSTSDIDILMQPENNKEFKKLLFVQFPDLVTEIGEFFNKL